ncbi:uncharacterized protein [Hetaerina americana]|uniref:uncharacterized protein n=1 Tax=Hetaerina americana TaxID=62018 RepID=UPI003A7F628C
MGSIWTIRWIRRFFRRRMKPVPIDQAHLWKQRLSIAYMLISWNAFGIVLYMMFTGRSDWAKAYGFASESDANIPRGRQWARTLNVENARVIQISGFNVTTEEDAKLKNEEFAEEKNE